MPPEMRRLSEVIFAGLDVPLAVRRMNPQDPLSLHAHDFVELVLILAGAGTHFTQDEAYDIAAGDVFVIHGEERHGYRETRGLHLCNILFQPHGLGLPLESLRELPGYHALFSLEPTFRRRDGFRGRLRLPPDRLAEAAGYVEALERELADRTAGYAWMARGAFIHLIGQLSRWYSTMEQAESQALVRLGAVLGHLESHYPEPVTVAALAAQAHMSESTLLRTFHQAVGTSPIDYLIQLRIEKGTERLRRTRDRIGAIAQAVGFADTNYFSRQFRRVVGVSPRRYRQISQRVVSEQENGTYPKKVRSGLSQPKARFDGR